MYKTLFQGFIKRGLIFNEAFFVFMDVCMDINLSVLHSESGHSNSVEIVIGYRSKSD